MVLELQHDLFLANQSNSILKINLEKNNTDKGKNDSRHASIDSMSKEEHARIERREQNERMDKKEEIERSDRKELNNRIERKEQEEKKERKEKEEKEQREKDDSNNIKIQKVYEKLFLEMDEKSRKEYEEKVQMKELEFKKILDIKDNEMRGFLQHKEEDFREQYLVLQEECDIANEDRDKLYKISELLHAKYNALLTDNATRDGMQQGTGKNTLFLLHFHSSICFLIASSPPSFPILLAVILILSYLLVTYRPTRVSHPWIPDSGPRSVSSLLSP